MLIATHHRKGVPITRKNGSPLQPGNAGNADTGSVAIVETSRHRKGAPKRRKNGSPAQEEGIGNAATAAVAMLAAERHRKGVPKRRENGSPLQEEGIGNAATAAVAMLAAERHRKGVPITREKVHLCNRAMPGTPPQALWQWSGPHAAAKVHPKGGKTVHLRRRKASETPAPTNLRH